MATQTPTVSTSVLGGQANGIGMVKMVIGTVTATAQDGSVRVLQIGDKVSANEVIQTGDLASIDIEFVNGSHMDLGRNAQAVLDTDVFNPATVQPLAADVVSIQAAIAAGADPSAVAAATAAGGDVLSIQAAIAAGADPTAIAAATAAGAAAGSEGGSTFVQVDPNYAQGNVTSGFDTDVVSRTFTITEGQAAGPVTQAPPGEPPIVLPPTVSANLEGGELVVKEDSGGIFTVTANAGDATDQITQVTFANLPADWVVTVTGTDGGSFNATTGVYTVVGSHQTVDLTVTATPPEDSDLDASGITITATAADISSPSLTATADTTVGFVTDAVLDQYARVGFVTDEVREQYSSAFGQERSMVVDESPEDQTINLGLSLNMENAGFAGSMAGGEDADGSESVSVTVTVNAGGLVLDGYEGGAYLEDNEDGSYTLTGFSGAEDLAAAVAALSVEVAAGWDGAITGSISTLAQEANTPAGTTPASGAEPDIGDNIRADIAGFSITVNPVVLPPTVEISLDEGPLVVKEDGSGSFTVTANAGDDTDQITQVVFGNLPSGWAISVTGDDGGSFSATTGIYTVSGTQQDVELTVTVAPPADSDLDASGITITATAADITSPTTIATESATVGIVTDAVLDQYAAVSATPVPDASELATAQTIGLGLNLSMISAGFPGSMAGGADTDSSELVSVKLVLGSALPTGASLSSSAGTVAQIGSTNEYTVAANAGSTLSDAVAGLTVTVPGVWDGTIAGSISTSAWEANTPAGTVPASGAEPDTLDNIRTDAIPFSVTVVDSVPHILVGSDSFTVDEDDLLPKGSDLTKEPVFVNGNIQDNVNWGADSFGSVSKVAWNGTDYTPTAGHIVVNGAGGAWTLDVTAATGAYVFTLLKNLTIAGAGENTVTLPAFTVTATDGDGSPVDITLNAGVVDDVPQPFAPDSSQVVDMVAIMHTVTNPLNFADRTGADAPGIVKFFDFTGHPAATDASGHQLTLNGENLYLYYGNAEHTILVGKTLSGEEGFKVTLNANDTYTLTTQGIIGNGQEVTQTTDLSGYGGAHLTWKGLVNISGTDNDTIISTKPGAYVNTNADSIGISDGQSISAGELVRFDFVNGLAVDKVGSDWTFSYTDHDLVKNFKQVIDWAQSNVDLKVTALVADNDKSFYGDSDDASINLSTSNILVFDASGADVTAAMIAAGKIVDSGNSITINGMADNWSFAVVTPTPQFNAIQIDGITGTDEFKLGDFSYGQTTVMPPIDLSFGINGFDSDGDLVGSTIDATLYPVAQSIEGGAGVDVLSGTAADNYILGYGDNDNLSGLGGNDVLSGGYGNDTLSGGTGNDKLYGGPGIDILNGGDGNDALYGGSGNDILNGDAGNDTLIGGIGTDALAGGLGSDTLVFKAADVGTGVDAISGFTVGAGGDVLHVADVLAGLPGFNPGTLDPVNHLGAFLKFETSGTNTIISVDLDGTGTGSAVPLVTLQGVTTNLAELLGSGQIDYTP